jgi:hypothetical protein
MFFSQHQGIIQRIRLNFRATKIWASRVVQNEQKERTHLWEYLRWHAKEILFCMLLGYLMARVDKFQHFFAAFALDIKSPTQNEPLWKFVLILTGNALMIAWLCFVFWHKPKSIRFPILLGRRLREGFEQYYRKPGGTWRVATISGLPFLLVDIALSMALLRQDSWEQQPLDTAGSPYWLVNNTGWVVLGSVFLFFAGSTLLRPRIPKIASLKHLHRRLRQNLLLLLLTIGCTMVFLRCYSQLDNHLVLVYPLLLGFAFIPPLVVTFVLNGFSACLIREKQDIHARNKAGHPVKKPKFDQAYRYLQISSYALSVVVFLLINNESVTVEPWYSDWMFPVAMLLFIFIFYYQVVDLLVYNTTPLRLSFLLVLVFGAIILFGNRAHYKLKFNGENTVGRQIKRASLDEYFLTWAAARYQENRDWRLHPDTVYLVAAEGGGSRSGAWTSAVLTRLDEQSGGRFRHNCFAISAVSGGSIGAAATLALWDNANERNSSETLLYSGVPSKRESYIKTIFRRNYLSTALAGLFFYDFFQQIPGIHWMYPSHYSRTDRLQNDESNAVDLALHNIFSGPENCRPDYLKKTSFLSLYYSTIRNSPEQIINTRLPLFFPNTCRVDDGRRGIVSPVETNQMSGNDRPGKEQLFTAAVDVIGSAWQEPDNKDRYLSLGEAASLSELFPYINATVYVGPYGGTFMDGGAYENLGLTTLYEIRRYLEINRRLPSQDLVTKILQDSSASAREDFMNYLSAIKFKTLAIYNYFNHGVENRSFPNQSSQLLSPVIALLNTPFSGHTDYMYHKMRQDFPGEVRDFPMIIPRDQRKYFVNRYGTDYSAPLAKNDQDAEIVMSRWLSKYELNNIMLAANKIRGVEDGAVQMSADH